MLVARSLFAGDTVTNTLAGVLKTGIDTSRGFSAGRPEPWLDRLASGRR